LIAKAAIYLQRFHIHLFKLKFWCVVPDLISINLFLTINIGDFAMFVLKRQQSTGAIRKYMNAILELKFIGAYMFCMRGAFLIANGHWKLPKLGM